MRNLELEALEMRRRMLEDDLSEAEERIKKDPHDLSAYGQAMSCFTRLGRDKEADEMERLYYNHKNNKRRG